MTWLWLHRRLVLLLVVVVVSLGVLGALTRPVAVAGPPTRVFYCGRIFYRRVCRRTWAPRTRAQVVELAAPDPDPWYFNAVHAGLEP